MLSAHNLTTRQALKRTDLTMRIELLIGIINMSLPIPGHSAPFYNLWLNEALEI